MLLPHTRGDCVMCWLLTRPTRNSAPEVLRGECRSSYWPGDVTAYSVDHSMLVMTSSDRGQTVSTTSGIASSWIMITRPPVSRRVKRAVPSAELTLKNSEDSLSKSTPLAPDHLVALSGDPVDLNPFMPKRNLVGGVRRTARS